jgi:ribosome-associated translation inhibitor RaiA
MIKIVFKNLESSELAKQIVKDRIEPVLAKFPKLLDHQVSVTLEMENSPSQAGPDLFNVIIQIKGKTYKFLKTEKSDINLYRAVAMASDGLFELLSKSNDKIKTKFSARSLVLGMFTLFFFASCSTRKNDKINIQDKIASEQVRTLNEIKLHSELILDAHPELTSEVKLRTKGLLQETLNRLQSLKDEESQIIQLLLNQSLMAKEPKKLAVDEQKLLKKRLEIVYKSKSENIFSLVSTIKMMSENQEINEGFKRDVEVFIRDFR